MSEDISFVPALGGATGVVGRGQRRCEHPVVHKSHAKSLQSCLTLRPRGHGILRARILEWAVNKNQVSLSVRTWHQALDTHILVSPRAGEGRNT